MNGSDCAKPTSRAFAGEAGRREHEQRIGDARHSRADDRDDLA
jgi:hypothetical protein